MKRHKIDTTNDKSYFSSVPRYVSTEVADAAPQEKNDGCMSPKFAMSYVVILLFIVALCSILMVAELGSLISFASNGSSSQPGTFFLLKSMSSSTNYIRLFF
jgi:hypothetical protein